ncbi:MAG TPA: hypothetical protein VGJ44_10700 [Kribbellaceae bacterium]|jgi:hypothetical protein
MLIHELLPLAGETASVVEVGPGALRDPLRVPEDVEHRRYGPDETAPFDAGTVVVGLIGPDPDAHVNPDAVAPALRLLPVGGRAVLLLAWPVDELPYHLLLGPLVDADCQVLQVVPLDRVSRHGAHCAVLAARVARIAPPRAYLDDTPIALTGDEPALRTMLRLSAEYAFGDLVARALRRHLADARDRLDAQERRIRALELDLKARDERIEATERRLEATRDDLARMRAATAF